MPERLRLNLDLPASPNTVFAGFTRADVLREWFWPTRFAPEVEVDLRRGGSFSIRSGPMHMGVSGHYSQIEEPHVLAFTWRWDGEEHSTQVNMTFQAAGATTSLTLTHAGFTGAEVRDNHIQGWIDCIARLEALLQRDSNVL